MYPLPRPLLQPPVTDPMSKNSYLSKSPRRLHNLLRGGLVSTLAVSLLALPSLSQAASGTWITNASGTWSGTQNWAGNVVADGVGDTADFSTLDITTATRTITINTTPRTVGVFNIGDTNNTHSYTIAASGGATLTFNNGGAGATINQTATSAANTFSTPIILADSLSLANSSTNTLTISGGVSGAFGITNIGVGSGTSTISGIIASNVAGVTQDSASSVLSLTGANLFTSGVTINQGTLRAGSNAALGTGTATLGAASGTNNATLLVNSSTLANTILARAGSSSNTLTIASDGNAAARITGNIVLDNNLTLRADGFKRGSNTGAVLATLGAISGTGNLNLVANGAASTSNNSGSPVTETLTVGGLVTTSGTITNSGAGQARVTISGSISNASGLNQDSATSVLTLSGSNSYSGDTNVNAGVLRINTNNALSANSTVNVASGGSLEMLNGSTALNPGQTVNLSGFGNSYSNGAVSSVNNANLAGSIVLQDDASVASNNANSTLTLSGTISGSGNTLTTGGAGTVTLSGPINTGAGGLTKEGSGTLNLNGANTFTGLTSLNQGVIVLGNANSLGGGGDLTFGGGAIRHSGSNTLDLGNRIVNSVGPISIDTNSLSTITYSNIDASNTGGLTKLGSGRLTLDGANAFSGPIAVNGGNLAVAATSAIPSVGTGSIFVDTAGALNSGGAYANVQDWLDSDNIATSSLGAIALGGSSSENIDFTGYSGLSLGASANSTYTGVITAANSTYRLGGGGATLTLSNNNALTGTNGLVVSNGAVTITEANDMSGATSVASNVLTLSGNAGALTNSSVTVGGGATLALVSGNSATPVTRADEVILDRGTLTVAGTTAADVTHAITNSLTMGSGGSSTVTMTGNVSRNVLLTADSIDRQAGGTGLIRGTNLGTDFIGVNNVVNIQLANPVLVGGLGANTTDGGIFVGLVGDTTTNGTGFAATGGLLTYDTNNGVRLLSDSEYKTTITDGQTQLDNVRLSSAGGTVLTTTVNTNSTINSLSIRATAAGSGVAVAGTGTLTLNSGVLYASNYSGANGAISIANSIDFNGGEGVILSAVTVASGLQLNGVLANTGSNGGIVIDGVANSGTITFGGTEANTYQGTTTVNGSTLRLNKTANLNAITGDLVVNTGGRVIYSANEQIADSSNVTVNAAFFQADGNETIGSLSANGASTVNVNGNFVVANDLSLASGAFLTNSTQSSLTVGGNMNLSDGGALRIQRSYNPDGAYDTSVTVDGLNITNAASGAYTAITIDHGASIAQSGGKLVLNGDVTFTGNSTNSNTVLIDSIKGSGRQGVVALNGTRVFDIGNGAAKVDLRITGAIVDETAGSGLTKNGQGTLDLTGASTFTGATTVNAGTLLINGSSVSAATVIGGILGGDGTITNSVSIGNSGTLSPGNSPGTLNTGSLSLTGTAATIVMEISGTATGLYDQVNVTGTVDLDGNGQIEVTMLSFVPQPTDIYFLILNDGVDAIDGTLYGIAQGGSFTSGGYTWQVSYTGDSTGGTFTGGNDLALQLVPEPSTWLLLTGGLMALTFLRRRRQA